MRGNTLDTLPFHHALHSSVHCIAKLVWQTAYPVIVQEGPRQVIHISAGVLAYCINIERGLVNQQTMLSAVSGAHLLYTFDPAQSVQRLLAFQRSPPDCRQWP